MTHDANTSAPAEYQNYLSDHLLDAYGEDIQKASSIKRAYHKANILPLVACEKADPILEIGPGYGEMIQLLLEHHCHNVVSIDISPEVVDHINRSFGQNHCFLALDASNYISQYKNHFGCVILLDVLEHIQKDSVIPLLRSIHSALKPGGMVVIQTPNASSPFAENIFFSDFTHQWDFTEFSMKQVLSSAGFTKSNIVGYKFPSGMIGSIRSIVRWFLHIGFYVGAIVNGIVRVKVLDPNIVAVAYK